MNGLQSGLRLALVQLAVTANKQTNLSRVKELVGQAASKGANLICLPECFNSPYGVQYFAEYAEAVPDGESTRVLRELANEHSVFLIGGSIPERDDDGKLYNVCVVHGPGGELLAKHRKVHLFDIDVPGGIKFTESDALSPGNALNTFQAGACKVGLGICYDLRFAEMAKQYNQQGCQLLVYPGAFNMTTGPAHWELLTRARSVDEQLYVACCSPARDVNASYVAWGHSLVCSPWGEVLATADEKEQIIYADIDLHRIAEIRTAVPIRHQQRPDVYKNIEI